MATVLGANSVTGGYDVDNSVRLDGYDSSSRMEYTASNASNRRTWTWSAWIKRSDKRTNNFQVLFSSTPTGPAERIMFEGDKLTYDHDKAGTDFSVSTPGVLRDLGAWYHVVVMKDTTQSTETNRIKIYVNGVQQTLAEVQEGFPGQNLESTINTAAETQLFAQGDGEEFGGYACEVVFCDGQSLAADSFGEFDSDSGIWKPIDVSGLTFGTNGYYLNFADSSALGTDVSGNGNDYATANLAATDQSTDTCTNNFCTLNALAARGSSGNTLAEGNLQYSAVADGGDSSVFGTIGIPPGMKVYFEVKLVQNTAQNSIGIHNLYDGGDGDFVKGGSEAGTYSFKPRGASSVTQYFNNGSANNHDVNNVANGTILGVAIDNDNGQIHYHIAGTYINSSDPTDNNPVALVTGFGGASEQYIHASLDTSGGTEPINQFNFGSPMHSISSSNADANGHGNFEFAVPSGYFALCTKNLAEHG